MATRIPLNGTYDDVQTAVWPTIFGLLRNAYIQAFQYSFDNNITPKDAFKSVKQDFEARRAAAKAQRQEKRAERKATRQEKRAERKAERKRKREARQRERAKQ